MGLLDGKVAIVTGAGRGIGRGEALELSRQGARVVVNDRGTALDGSGQDARVADGVVDEIRAAGGKACAHTEDIGVASGASSLVDCALEAFGRLDIVVNNAGIFRITPLLEISEAEWDDLLRVHLKATFLVTQTAARHWTRNDIRGRVINTTSGSGLFGSQDRVHYGAAKGGVAAFTVSSSIDLANAGITVNAIVPIARTRMIAAVSAMEAPEGDFDRLHPDHVAPLVAYLASDEAQWISGRVFHVSGGAVGMYDGWRVSEIVERDGPFEARDLGPVLHSLAYGAQTGPQRYMELGQTLLRREIRRAAEAAGAPEGPGQGGDQAPGQSPTAPRIRKG